MTGTVLLALESDRTERAVERALDLAEREDATVHALFVVDTARYGEPALSSAEVVVDGVEDEGHDRLRAVAERGRDRGVEVSTRCCHGRPNEQLVAHAIDLEPETVVLSGRRPRRVVRELERLAEVYAPGQRVTE